MFNIKDGLQLFAHKAEIIFDNTRLKLKLKFNLIDPVKIIPYRGYGNGERVVFRGRVLEQEGIRKPSPDDSLWRNFHSTFKRLESDEIPWVEVEAEINGQKFTVETTSEGYFVFEEKIPAADSGLLPVSVKLTRQIVKGQDEVTAKGEIEIPPESCEYGIISDIDDTVIRTGATSFFRMMKLTLFRNALTRVPFEGVAAFYRELKNGSAGNAGNPLFYVSGSPWNLYDVLTEFMEDNDIPKGALFLRDFGLEQSVVFAASTQDHKLDSIGRIMEMYPDMKFVLIGDSGEKDPEIYSRVVEYYPGRIKAVYIRDVTGRERDKKVQRLVKRMKNKGIDFVFSENSYEAAKHAADTGLIDGEKLGEIEKEVKKDQNKSKTTGIS